MILKIYFYCKLSYFKKIKDTVTSTKESLQKGVSDIKSGGNPNSAETETAVNKLVAETLDKIIDGAKTVSEAIGDVNAPIGNIADQATAGTAAEKVI
ncbi:Variable outer membrane protein (plasmid) [Borrelia hermsii YBT]|uniref:Variable large protein n=1 Tax=Borrelia hermsii YBT TaxID=1313295 RepID=W5T1L4_BORHE|nr:Variable outer membrane protein [Borrelia hermsii YBT]